MNITTNKSKNSHPYRVPDIFDPTVQERLYDVNIDLFYEDSITSIYPIEHERDIRDLYRMYSYFQKKYNENNINEYCEYVETIFFDDTYTIEDNLAKRLSKLKAYVTLLNERGYLNGKV